MKEFDKIWNEAREAASTTVQEPHIFKGCGFAWITIPGRGNFAKWAKENLDADKNYTGPGLNIWYSRVYDTRSQNLDEHYEACRKAAKILNDYGIDATVNCRWD